MKKIILSLIFTIALSFMFCPIIKYYVPTEQPIMLYLSIFIMVLFLCMYFIVRRTCYYIKNLFLLIDNVLKKIDFNRFAIGLIGVFLGGVYWNVMIIPINNNGNYVFKFICILGEIVFGILGYIILQSNYKNLNTMFNKYFLNINNTSTNNKDKPLGAKGIPKILDTSVIIDGRIYDICKSGFIEGEIIIPNVVLEELRHIADSSDTLKRNRGRRGLDVLKNIQSNMPVIIEEVRGMDGMEVDSILLKLAKNMNAKVITNDYNLNKVAAVQNVEVLNINELANCIKSIVLPGEEMIVKVMKDGKENGQGIAYLEDGTMIVVEGGKYLIGRNLGVIVTSVLQTAAGRMIFAKPKEEENVS